MMIGNPRLIRAGLAALAALGLAGTIPGRTASAAEEPRKVAWRDDLGQAQAEAKSRDMLLWIQFTGPWCINCRRMDRSAFVHAGVVVESRERFVPVKLRADEHESLTSTLGLTTLPATVIVRPNGEVVEKLEGYNDPESFEGFLQAVARAEGRSAEQVAARARAKAAKDRAVALAGFCPVTLLKEQRLVAGKVELAAEHDGRVFRFADEARRAAFLERPDYFAPANDGRCPVSQVDRGDFLTGDPRWGVVYTGHLFLFKDGAERDRFAADPERYAHVDAQERSRCLHCRTRYSLASRTPGRFAATYRTSDYPPATAGRLEALMASGGVVRR